MIVKLSDALIVPVGLCGTEKLLPISDIDMSGENFKNADVCVNIGKPVELPKANENEQRHEYENRSLEFIMKKIAVLLPESYRGFYGK